MMPLDAGEAHIHVRLYVAGSGPNSGSAVATLRSLIAEFPRDTVELEIIDVVGQPERSLGDGVLVTPMLIRVAPLPQRRILGRLGDRQQLLDVLGLTEPRGT
jgi:circadian clock protein KaiB